MSAKWVGGWREPALSGKILANFAMHRQTLRTCADKESKFLPKFAAPDQNMRIKICGDINKNPGLGQWTAAAADAAAWQRRFPQCTKRRSMASPPPRVGAAPRELACRWRLYLFRAEGANSHLPALATAMGGASRVAAAGQDELLGRRRTGQY